MNSEKQDVSLEQLVEGLDDFLARKSRDHLGKQAQKSSTPFLNGACASYTSLPDAASETSSGVVNIKGMDASDAKTPKGNGNRSKAASFQDIHSAHIKRRYQHVTSKVGKYIADMHAEDEARRASLSSSSFERHCSLPDSLNPKSLSPGELFKKDDPLAIFSERGDASYKLPYYRLVEEIKELQKEQERQVSYNNYIQSKLDKKVIESMQMRINFENLRTQLNDCKAKLNSYQTGSTNWPPVSKTQGTQTDLHNLQSDVVSSASPDSTMRDITVENSSYNNSHTFNMIAKHNPHAALCEELTYESFRGAGKGGEVSSSSRSGLALNSLDVHVSGDDDSIVEVDASMMPPDWHLRRHSNALYYLDKSQNRIIEMVSVDLGQLKSDSLGQGEAPVLNDSMSMIKFQTKQRSLGSRMMHMLVPCLRCSEADETVSLEIKQCSIDQLTQEDGDAAATTTDLR
ncbi:hypothetical protein KR074_006846 [Drosophila pseudoananassae]|nr:hypothetical protein KR074_006846 [Drosophila pseudoananassae]